MVLRLNNNHCCEVKLPAEVRWDEQMNPSVIASNETILFHNTLPAFICAEAETAQPWFHSFALLNTSSQTKPLRTPNYS